MYKWIFAVVGFLFTKRVWGAIIGYFIGSFIGKLFGENTQQFTNNSGGASAGSNYTRSERQSAATQQVEDKARHDFLYSLMVLSAHIISADGKIMHSEMEFVRNFLRANFDEATVTQCNEILLKLFEYKKNNSNAMWQKQIMTSCYRMTSSMPEEFRQQLIAYLCEIAKADGRIDKKEIDALRHIAISLNMDASIIDQALNMGGTSIEQAYKTLGITPEATDDEVRKAYKRMAQKYHPDLVSNLGEDVRKAAEKKFQEIGNAKDAIYKVRGMKR